MNNHLKQLKYILVFSFLLTNLNSVISQDRVELYNQLIDSIKLKRLQQAGPMPQLDLCKEALSIAEQMEDKDKVLSVCLYMLDPILSSMDSESFQLYLNKGLPIAESMEDSSNKAKYLGGLGNYYMRAGPMETASYYSQYSLKVAEAIKDSSILADMYSRYAWIVETGDDSIQYYLEKSLEINLDIKDSSGIARSYGNLGVFFLNYKSDLDKTIEYITASNDIFHLQKKDFFLGTGYFNLSKVYMMKADYESAIKYAQLSLEVKERSNDQYGIINAYQILGDIHLEMDRKEDALDYYNKGRFKAEQTSNNGLLGYLYESLAELYLEIEIDSASYFYTKNLELANTFGHQLGQGISNFGLGVVAYKKEQYELAENYMSKGLDLMVDTDNQMNYNPALLKMSEMYLEWFEKSEKASTKGPNLENVQEVLDDFNQVMTVEEPYENRKLLYQNYSKLYEAKKNFNLQAFYQSKLLSLQDSFIVNRNIEVANEYAEKLKTTEKEKEIIALEAENKIASFRNTMFSYALGATVLFFGLVFYFFRRFTKIRQRETQLEENQKFRTRLSRNLHDDVSSLLNSLAMQTELAAMEIADDKKDTFNNIVINSRKAVQNMRDTVWAIDSSKDKYENLLDRILDYAEENLDLKDFKLNFEKFNWRSDMHVLPEHRQNIYLIFKEAITNILKHAKGDVVNIGVGFDQNQFVLDIHNNGLVERVKTSGVGTESMKKRAQEIGASIDFSTDNGFRVNLKMPLVQKNLN